MKTIEEYLNSEPIFEKKKNNPLISVLIIVASIVILILSLQMSAGDSVRMLLLSVGILGILVGAGLFIGQCCSSHYEYSPTHSKMKRYHRYIDSDNRQLCRDILSNKDMTKLSGVQTCASSSFMLVFYLSVDKQFGVVQLQEYIPHNFEPTTEVETLNTDGVKAIQHILCCEQ